MTLAFYKYQGTGNDFVIIDNRQNILSKNDTKLISHLCDRKFGIGGDGCMFLENSDDVDDDFKMVYFNADGYEGSMCGNGGRCLVAFASFLGIITGSTTFSAVDGKHYAEIKGEQVSLQMHDVSDILCYETHSFLNTGSPHHIAVVKNLATYDVFNKGREIRNGAPYYKEGSNVNFVEKKDDALFAVRTYERGVENETLSCGTGVTAVALAMHKTGLTDHQNITIETPGGSLQIKFKKTASRFKDIFLIGSALQVFKGEITW